MLPRWPAAAERGCEPIARDTADGRPGRATPSVTAAIATAFALLIATVLVPRPADAQGATIQALAVGDSITYTPSPPAPSPSGYGPIFVRKFVKRGLGKAHYRAQAATSPCTAPWAQWIRDFPKPRIDYVVIEDWYVQNYGPPELPCPSEDAWRAAWQEVVNAAKEKSAFVIVLAGTHPDLSTLTGIDILDYPVAPPDSSDGIHYTHPGYKFYAKNVVSLLDSLIR